MMLHEVLAHVASDDPMSKHLAQLALCGQQLWKQITPKPKRKWWQRFSREREAEHVS
jgi:hypothetical protein